MSSPQAILVQPPSGLETSAKLPFTFGRIMRYRFCISRLGIESCTLVRQLRQLLLDHHSPLLRSISMSPPSSHCNDVRCAFESANPNLRARESLDMIMFTQRYSWVMLTSLSEMNGTSNGLAIVVVSNPR